jgi:hypothetical protein
MDVLLFSHDAPYAAAAIAGGVAQVIVDWEHSGKPERQFGRDTEINRGTVADLVAVRAAAGARVVCRINNTDAARDAECERVIEHGAGEVWLPMVRTAGEVERCLRRIDGRARLGVLAETREALQLGRELGALPLSRVYVGLHDYRIDCGHAGLFDPLVDGTLDRFRADYAGALGVAGVTVPGAGHPVPQALLLAAMARLDCAFGVARRSFRADVEAADIGLAIARIAAHVAGLSARSPAQVEVDHRHLAALLDGLPATRPRPAPQVGACVP